MSPYRTTQEEKKGKDKETRREEGSRGVKRLQSCWAEGETLWHIPHSELGPDQNGCVIKWTVMLVPDTLQPSLELVTVLFSLKVPFRGQCLFASITVCNGSTHTLKKDTEKGRLYMGRGPLSISQHSREESRSGTKEACFAVFHSGSLSVHVKDRDQ